MSVRSVVTLAALLAAAPATAYQQTTQGGLKLHWTTPSVSWFLNTCRPESSPSCQIGASSNPAEDAVRAAFATWEGATRAGGTTPCSGLALPYAGHTSSVAVGADSSQHLVVFRQGWCSSNPDARADSCYAKGTCSNKYNCFDDQGGMGRNVLALTTVVYVSGNGPSAGTITDADMEVVDWGGLPGSLSSPQPDGWYWTCFVPGPSDRQCTTYGQAGCYFMDLQNTVTHEAGHFIGLAHPCENDQATATANGVPLCNTDPAFAQTTMYPSASVGETSKRTLSADDIEGVCTIYPRTSTAPLSGVASAAEFGAVTSPVTSADSYACVPRPSSSNSSGGCGSSGATPVGLGALALALMALLPRARRRARR